jgi:hypothetical protein
MAHLPGEIIRADDEPDVDMVRMYVSTTFSLSASVTLFAFTKQASNGGNMALSSGNGGFVATRTGLHVISWFMRTVRNTSGDAVLQWRLNAGGNGANGTQMSANYGAIVSGTAGNFSPSGSFAYYMAAGDTAEMFHNAGGAMSNWIVGGATVSQASVYRVPGTALTS